MNPDKWKDVSKEIVMQFVESGHIYDEGFEKVERAITKALREAYEHGRLAMCPHKERDEIGGDCEVCAEIVLEGGKAYKRGYEQGLEDAAKVAEKYIGREHGDECECGSVWGIECYLPEEISQAIRKLKGTRV